MLNFYLFLAMIVNVSFSIDPFAAVLKITKVAPVCKKRDRKLLSECRITLVLNQFFQYLRRKSPSYALSCPFKINIIYCIVRESFSTN